MKLFRAWRARPVPMPPAPQLSETEEHIQTIISSSRISPLALWDPQMSNAMPVSGLASLAELKIRQAIRNGMFDDLEGHGRPIQPGFDSPFVDSHEAVMNRVLVKNGVAPPWIEVGMGETRVGCQGHLKTRPLRQSGNAVEKDIVDFRRRMRKEWESRKRYLDVLEQGPWRDDLERRYQGWFLFACGVFQDTPNVRVKGQTNPTLIVVEPSGLNERIRHYNLITPAPFLEKSPVLLSNEISHMLEDMPPRERPRPKKIECW